jgi:TfoX/Sxy family transcriptional regulator of competence genes
MADAPDVSRRKMFGYPACFTGGHLFTSLHEDRWILRLDPAGLAELEALGGTPFEPMAGRAMTGFLVMPVALREDDATLDGWVGRALAHARSRPPK